MPNRPLTQVTVTQEVKHLDSAGKATAFEVGQVSGNVTIRSYNYQYRDLASPPKPPELKTICAYLLEARRRETPDEGASKEETEIWKIGFRAHSNEQEQAQDLYKVVQKILNERQQHGGFQRVMLLSDSGVGKTPSLYYLRHRRAEDTISLMDCKSQTTGKSARNAEQWVVPLYIKLADLTTDQPLISLIRDAFNRFIHRDKELDKITSEQAIGLLEEYRCLFLFDDLGELLSKGKLGGFQALNHFMEVYREKHQYVISCQTSRYRQQLGVLDTLYLDELTEEDVKPIVGEEAYERLSPFSRQLARNRRILTQYIRLGRSSDLLLTTGRLAQILIQHKIDLYGRTQTEHTLNPGIIAGILEQLAIEMRFDRNHCLSERELMEFLTGYLKAWQEPLHWRVVAQELELAGFLTYENENRLWRFGDASDDAYFSAAALLHNQSLLERVLDEASDYWWRDVFELLVGLYPEPRELLLELIDRDALVAANCLRFVGESAGGAVEDALIDALDERLKLENSARRKYIIERLGESSHPRAAEALLRAIHREWSSMVIMGAVKSLIAWHQRTHLPIAEAEKRILHSLAGPIEFISNLFALYFSKASKPRTVKRLVDFIENPTCPSKTKGVAVIELGLMGTDEALDVLCNLLWSEHPDDFIAWCAVEALTLYNRPEIFEYAVKYLNKKETRRKKLSHQRARAVYLLGWMGEGSEELLKRALGDSNYFVRGYAIEAMARRDMVGARQQIEMMLSSEPEQFVLRKAAEALGRIGTLDSIPILEQHLLQENARARWAVRQAIAEIKERNSVYGFHFTY